MSNGSHGFWAFYRQYTRSGIHAAATAGLTAAGLLVFVHWSFAILAISIYVLPPVVLYLHENPEGERSPDTDSVGTSHGTDEPETDSEPTENPADRTPVPDSTATDGSIDSRATDENTDTAVGGPNTAEAGSTPEQSTTTSADREPADAGGVADEQPPEMEDDRGERADRATTASRETPESEPGSVSDSERHEVDPDSGGGVDPDGEPTFETSGTPADTGGDQDDVDREWVESESPTDEGLCDVVIARDGPYAIGDEGGVFTTGDGWETVLEHGPTTEGNALCGAAVSTDSRHVWFAGNSGVLGQYDVEQSRLTDYSAPRDITNNWADVAAIGPAGKETLYLVDGSGQLLRGENDGGELTWDEPRTPGSGSSMTSVVFIEEAGYCCDTNAGVFETTDGGDSWERIGIEDAGADFTDIAPVSPEAISVSCDDGTVFRYDGANWTKLYVGEESLCAIDRTDETGLICGSDGAIYERTQGGWEREPTPVEGTLHGIAIGRDCPSIAVGEDGTILEHTRSP